MVSHKKALELHLLIDEDALLDLHAKLSTVVRYYDRMLEERLSNTYNQHTISGYNIPQRATPNIYPSIASHVPSGAESFYTGNPEPEAYGRPQSTFYAPPQKQFPEYNKKASIANQGYPAMDQHNGNYNQYATPPQPQRTSSWQANDPSSTPTPANPGYPTPNQLNENHNQYRPQTQPPQPQRSGSWQATDTSSLTQISQGPNYPLENTPHQQALPAVAAPSQPPSSYAPSEPSLPNPKEAYYYSNASQISSQQVPEHNQPQYPPTQSPQLYHATVPQQASPQQFTHQVTKQQTAPVIPQQQQASYWQVQPQNAVAQQAWQAPGSTHSGYTQESFPSAPNHAPQKKMMEESLIDL
jgi:growth factor-regulated tyrosine kinase substrate